MIRRDQRAGACHVLHDEIGIPGNMLSPVLRDEPRISIIEASSRGPGDQRDRLPSIERCLRLKARVPCQQDEKAQKDFLHSVFPPPSDRPITLWSAARRQELPFGYFAEMFSFAG